MSDAPERIWAWEYKGNSPWGPIKPDLNVVTNGAEYIRADLVDAIIAATLERAAGAALIYFVDAGITAARERTAAKEIATTIRALNTPETRAEILADALKGKTNE